MLARDASIVRWAQAERLNATAEQPMPVKITVRIDAGVDRAEPVDDDERDRDERDHRELDRREPEDVEAVGEHPGADVPAAEQRPR